MAEMILNIKKEFSNPSPKGAPVPQRFPLDEERHSKTVKFKIHAGDGEKTRLVEGYFTVGVYNDGCPGELFIWVDKEGTETHGWANSWSKAISMLLQFGVHPADIYQRFEHIDFEPKGITNLKSVPICKSVIDMIMKYMKVNFPPTGDIDKNTNGYNSIIQAVINEDED